MASLLTNRGGCPKKHIAVWMSSKKGSHGLEHDWWWEYSLHISDVIKLNLERVFNYPPSYQRVNWICCQLNIMTNITKSIEHRQCPAFSHVLSHVFFNICSILFLLCSHVLMIFPVFPHVFLVLFQVYPTIVPCFRVFPTLHIKSIKNPTGWAPH